MAHPKVRRRQGLTLLLALLLTGCAGRPLSEREIVRAVFFATERGEHTAVMVIQDQQQEETSDFRVVTGSGKTAAQALESAARRLDGEAFYGALDLVGLPADTGYSQLHQYAQLIRRTARPAPEVSLWLLDAPAAEKLPDKAGELCGAILQRERQEDVSCTLETISARQGISPLPVWRDEEYGFAVLSDRAEPILLTRALDAQLAAILCGQAGRLDAADARRQYACRANVSVRCHADRQRLTVRLLLKDAELRPLSETPPDGDTDLRQKLAEDLQSAFARLYEKTAQAQLDPWRFSFWTEVLLGDGAAPLPAVLQVEFAA